MENQLALIEIERPARRAWELDSKTREIGRQGVAEARKALLEAMNKRSASSSAAA